MVKIFIWTLFTLPAAQAWLAPWLSLAGSLLFWALAGLLLRVVIYRAIRGLVRRTDSDVDDVLLWNDRGEVTESTVGNVVVEIGGVRYTPPVRSGLLAGTFRAELLDEGLIRERALSKTEVASAGRLWLINSLRGWVEARLV